MSGTVARGVGLLAAVVLVAGCSAAGTSSQSQSASKPVRTDATVPVRDGELVSANGTVLALPGRPVRFCQPAAALGSQPVGSPLVSCGAAVDVMGVDLAVLADRVAVGAAVQGRARLTGVYRGGTVTVSRQQQPDPQGPGVPDRVPCAAPAGGWPRIAPNGDIGVDPADRWGAAHPGQLVQLSVAHPSASHEVLTLAVRDPTAATAALRRYYGRLLCVVAARYTLTQVGQARHELNALLGSGPGQLSRVGTQVTDGQPQVGGSTAMLTPSLAALARRHPAGLISFDAWLQVVC